MSTLTKLVMVSLALTLLAGCAGSPIRDDWAGVQSAAEYAETHFIERSTEKLCDRKEDPPACRGEISGTFTEFCAKYLEAVTYALTNLKGLRADHCLPWVTETYNIDLLRVTTSTRNNVDYCASGGVHKILIEGQISPDSSFALDKLLSRLEPCKAQSGKVLMPVSISLSSGGGLLDDGYALGETFRRKEVTAVIESSKTCASSCAVAFLGAKKRVVESQGQIMFHAPYFNGANEYGKRDVNCDVGRETLDKLEQYFVTMTSKDTGERLFERTMWYCSAEDGWVVTGGAAAELYGIATEK